MIGSRYVTLVNRTSRPLKGTWDGRHFNVAPGKSGYPLVVAEAIKRQNPVMGTQGTEVWDVKYLVGIEEQGDDCSPIEQSDKKELMDPEVLHAGKQMTEVRGVTGLYGRGSVHTPPVDNGMTKSSFERD